MIFNQCPIGADRKTTLYQLYINDTERDYSNGWLCAGGAAKKHYTHEHFNGNSSIKKQADHAYEYKLYLPVGILLSVHTWPVL